jgi:ferric-dicitrate binding protein FerR (iron transport regulator)
MPTAIRSTPRAPYTRRVPNKPPRKRTIRLDREGCVRIPRRMLAKAKLKPGDEVEIEATRDGVTLHPPAPEGLVWDRGLLVIDGKPLEDPVKAVRRLEREDAAAIARRALGR